MNRINPKKKIKRVEFYDFKTIFCLEIFYVFKDIFILKKNFNFFYKTFCKNSHQKLFYDLKKKFFLFFYEVEICMNFIHTDLWMWGDVPILSESFQTMVM